MTTQLLGLATQERWNKLFVTLDSLVKLEDIHKMIVSAYTQTNRHYHNLQHISNCLEEFDSVGSTSFNRPREAELALWFHDFVYNTSRTDNEEKSSLVATAMLWAIGIDLDSKTRIGNLILTTKHLGNETNIDAQLICDIDLATLGKPKTMFDEYEKAIREEYFWIPEEKYNSARIKVLEKFLERDNIYYNGFFREKYESQARINIMKSIKLLRLSE